MTWVHKLLVVRPHLVDPVIHAQLFVEWLLAHARLLVAALIKNLKSLRESLLGISVSFGFQGSHLVVPSPAAQHRRQW